MELQDTQREVQHAENLSDLNRRLVDMTRTLELHDKQHRESREIWTAIIVKLNAIDDKIERSNQRMELIERNAGQKKDTVNRGQEPTDELQGQSGNSEISNVGYEIESSSNFDVQVGSSLSSKNGK